MDTQELKSTLTLKLRLAFVGALSLFISTGLVSQYSLSRSRNYAGAVAHTYEVLRQLQRLSAAVHLTQRDERGYLLSTDGRLITSFRQGWSRIALHLRTVRQLTEDNAVQQRRLDQLTPLLDESRTLGEELMHTAERDRQKAAAQYAVSSGTTEESLARIEDLFREMRDTEDGLLRQRTELWQNSSWSAAVLLAVGTILGTLLIALSIAWIYYDLRQRARTEAMLLQLRAQLETRVKERTADLSQTMASLESEVAERRTAEERLRQSERRYRLLFEDSPLPMEIFDPETLRYLDVNREAEQLYGYTREEFQRLTLRDTRPPEELPALMDFLEKVKDVEAYSGTFVTRHKSGKLITIEARVRTIEYEGRKARLKLVTDVTENKRLESQVRQLQKIEAVGRLAGGIAHDFNNLLTVILGYSDGILATADLPDAVRERVLAIQAAGQRAANLTKQLLAFSRKQILKPQVLDLNSVVANISQMLRRLLGDDIRVSLHLDNGLGQIQADPTQLEQALVNLSVNARDAMPKGGQLVIETHNVDLAEEMAMLQGVAPGRYVVLEVSDTGIGMDEETKARVFEPFFTTKEVGKGTGLGLSMVLGFVQQSGGAVTIYSELGIGTTFKIYLPRLDAPVSREEEPKVTRHARAKTGATILLVEDEPSLRALGREVLLAAGYAVREASNGKEALKLAQQFTLPPDVLLTDVVMPEMSGLDLAQELRRKWPEVVVVYTSGYTDHVLLERNALQQDTLFLQKPYMPATLLELIAKALDDESRNKPKPRPTAADRESEPEMAGKLS